MLFLGDSKAALHMATSRSTTLGEKRERGQKLKDLPELGSHTISSIGPPFGGSQHLLPAVPFKSKHAYGFFIRKYRLLIKIQVTGAVGWLSH